MAWAWAWAPQLACVMDSESGKQSVRASGNVWGSEWARPKGPELVQLMECERDHSSDCEWAYMWDVWSARGSAILSGGQ